MPDAEYRYAVNIADWLKLLYTDIDAYMVIRPALCQQFFSVGDDEGAVIFCGDETRCLPIIERLWQLYPEVRFYRGMVGACAWQLYEAAHK